ncbi:MAG: arylesterase [Hyphomicrobiales bacterium]|nr:MAG: arylesterase [Hyphomicrobiales bacterium]
MASAASDSGLKIVVLGDSLVAGYGLGPGEGFPEQMAKSLAKSREKLEIINAGVSGDTSAGGLARLDWSVPEKIDGVILELGANDALRGLAPELTRQNLEKMIISLQQRDIEVLLVGMRAPPNMGKLYEDDFNAIYPDLAEKYKLVFYPFFLEGVVAKPELNQADAMHPTAEGVGVIVERFLPTMEIFLRRLSGD